MSNSLEKEFESHNAFTYITEMSLKKEENGKWYVKQIITQSYSDDLKSWEKVSTEFEAKSFSLEKAIAEVSVLSTLYLQAVDYNLFSESDLELEEGEYLQ